MKTIQSLDQLSAEELTRIRRTLQRRYRCGPRARILEIGFGIAERNMKLDHERTHAICFIVQRKRTPRSKQARIPAVEEVRLRRGRSFVRVRLPTDVVEANPQQLRLTRREVRHQASTQTAIASCLLAWRAAHESAYSWALLTVGHPFWHLAEVPEKQARVRIEGSSAGAEVSSPPCHGRVIARSGRRSRDGVDAALLQISPEQVENERWVTDREIPVSLPIRSTSAITADVTRQGKTLLREADVHFVVIRYYPLFSLLPEVGLIRDVVEVESPFAATFSPGRSGSLWEIDDQPCCLQFAGWLHPTLPALSYRRGLGQALESVTQWARQTLAELKGVAVSDIELRLTRQL